jgi:rRNA small subunit pseudouridine methyltransferase Nep1
LLILILAESALETLPKEIWAHPAVKRYVTKRRKHPQHILLDRSYHHAAMKKLEHSEKRGRPDITHIALLEALGSPLNKEGLLKVYVHTIHDNVISIDPATRLPRNYERFVSLLEQLFQFGKVPPQPSKKALLTLKCQTLPKLIQEINPSYVLAFTRIGKPKTLEETVSNILNNKKIAVLIGGFPTGHFSETTMKLANETVCIDSEMLETWTVTSRIIYEYERQITLPTKRLQKFNPHFRKSKSTMPFP